MKSNFLCLYLLRRAGFKICLLFQVPWTNVGKKRVFQGTLICIIPLASICFHIAWNNLVTVLEKMCSCIFTLKGEPHQKTFKKKEERHVLFPTISNCVYFCSTSGNINKRLWPNKSLSVHQSSFFLIGISIHHTVIHTLEELLLIICVPIN